MLEMFTPRRTALIILFVAAATIAGAWVFQWYGYAPCDLCLQQRWAYYAGIPLAAITALVVWRGSVSLAKMLLLVLALVFLGSAVFGVYHAGVEWGAWPGPAGCTGAIPQKAQSMSDFMQQLKVVKIVRCDEVALRIFGLSLAGWNAVISLALAAMAFKAGRSAEN